MSGNSSLPHAELLPVIFRLTRNTMPLLLGLPTDLLRLILSYVARYPLSHINARFVCRRFRDLLLPPLSQKTRQQARYFCHFAARHGYLNLIKWARANGCPWDENTCYRAAEGGHLEMLIWARANGCPWDERTCSSAANGGHLEVLQWARANGCFWNEFTCSFAALGGHLKVLQWAISNGCPYNRDQLCRLPKVKEWLASGALKL